MELYALPASEANRNAWPVIPGPDIPADVARQRLPQTSIDRIDFDAEGGHWLWTGARTPLGYGSHTRHRRMWEIQVGPIPEIFVLDHLCREPACVRPLHLQPVDHAENVRRGSRLITACPHGHLYDGPNTRLTPQGHRRCRTCHRQRENARYHASTGSGLGVAA